MNESEVDRLLRAAAAQTPPPTFSDAFHQRVMERVRQEALATKPRWQRVAVASCVAAGVALLVGVISIRQAGPTDRQRSAEPVVAVLAVPSETVTRGAGQAHDGLESLIASSNVASLDRDAVRLTEFLVNQLRSVRFPPDDVKVGHPPEQF